MPCSVGLTQFFARAGERGNLKVMNSHTDNHEISKASGIQFQNIDCSSQFPHFKVQTLEQFRNEKLIQDLGSAETSLPTWSASPAQGVCLSSSGKRLRKIIKHGKSRRRLSPRLHMSLPTCAKSFAHVAAYMCKTVTEKPLGFSAYHVQAM